MRIQEFYNLNKKQQKKVVEDSIKRIEKAGRKLTKLGIWNFPKNIKKRLKKGETITVWKSKCCMGGCGDINCKHC